MNVQEASKNSNSNAVANVGEQSESFVPQAIFTDNRPEAIAQRKLQTLMHHNLQMGKSRAMQTKINNSPQVQERKVMQRMINTSMRGNPPWNGIASGPVQVLDEAALMQDNLKASIAVQPTSVYEDRPVQRIMAAAGMDKAKMRKALRSTVYLYASYNGEPLGPNNGIFTTGDGNHAEINLINYMIKNVKPEGGILRVFLSTSPCSSEFGTGTGCMEALRKFADDHATEISITAAHLYQPKDLASDAREYGGCAGSTSYAALSTSDMSYKIGHLQKDLQDPELQSPDFNDSDEVMQLRKNSNHFAFNPDNGQTEVS